MAVIVNERLSEDEYKLVREFRAEQAKKRREEISANIRTLSSYSDAEKQDRFDELFNLAKNHFEQVQNFGDYDEDTKQWFFEAMMGLLGLKVWDSYNKFLR